MANKIYVFSGTGNSLYIAQKVKDTLLDTEIIRINRKLFSKPVSIEADILGFVFPVHAFGAHIMVKDLIRKASKIKANYTFVIENNGGAAGSTLKDFSELLENKGCKAGGLFSIHMPSNNIARKKSSAYGKNIQAKLIESEKTLAETIEKTSKKTVNPAPEEIFPSALFLKIIHLIYEIFFKLVVNRSDHSFHTSPNCTGCNTCVKICPAQNILLNRHNKPEWKHRCVSCMACIQWCPREAINSGNITKDRPRYRHPKIKIAEMIINP
jgi:ferredoxin